MRVTTSHTGETVGFDGLRAVVGAGEGVVGRFPGIVCVARCPDPGPLREFLALCASVGGPDPGRALARRLATWMSGSAAPGPELRFGTIAAAGDQLAVFLVGAVEARVDGLGGLTLSGAHAAIGTDRLFSRPRTPVVLSLDGGQVRADPADVYDLQAGVVPGAGVVLHPATFDRDEPAAEENYAEDDAALVGHEWFDTADLTSDPLGQPPWSPDVPAQRTSGRNGTTHRPDTAEDVEWGASSSDPDPERGLGWDAADDAVFGAGPADDDPLNGSHGGRHALLHLGDPEVADTAPTPHDDGSAEARSADPRSPDLRALDPRTGDPPDSPSDDPAVEQHAGSDDPDLWDVGPFGDPAADHGAGSRRPDLRAVDPLEDLPLPVDRPTLDTSVDAGVDSLFDPTPSGVAHDAAPASGYEADAPSIDQATSAPVAGDPAADLFAVGPRADSQPDTAKDARIGHPPPSPTVRRAPADPGSDRRGTDQAESAARIRDDLPPGPADTAGVRGPSAAEATSTMPGLLFRPSGDPADADPLFATQVPDARQPPELVDPTRGGARIRGYRCESGHLNDPRSPTCRHCGATIDERAGGLVAGPRPPLGRLVFDDGEAHVVDGGYLVGRMPEVDDRVRNGELRPIVVEDRAGSVSRVHAEIRVSGWDVIVVDTGSRNGTYVSGPEEGTWTALPPRRSRRLLPGARVRMGGRMFVFESSSTVR